MANKKQIKNENDFLGCLIAYSDENDNCDINVIFKNCDIENLNASYYLTLPTAKAGGFLLQPLLHWMIFNVLHNVHKLDYTVPVCPTVQSYIYLRCSCLRCPHS